MKEIKFRIKHYDKWYYGVPLRCFKHKDEELCTFMGFDDTYYDVFADATTLGQYTGLKDKNGVEIYEGDIVKTTDFEGGHKIGKVVYSDGACCYRIWGDLFDYGLGIYQDDNIEVIGNIYDNPELLEEKK